MLLTIGERSPIVVDMIRYARRKGFTAVELLVVIVVIVILALITGLMYTNAQVQANDVKIKDAAYKVSDAVQLFIQQKYTPGTVPLGMTSSSSAIGADGKCPNGTGMGPVAKGNTTCSMEDMLVTSGYLPTDFMSAVPANPNMANTSNTQAIVYIQGTTTSYGMVMYAQADPTAEDTAHFLDEAKKCGFTTTAQATAKLPDQTNAATYKDGTCFRIW